MRVLARDYLAFHRKEVLYTLMWAYVGTIALAAGILLRVWAQEK